MRVSYKWLSQYLSLQLSPEELSRILTENGLEVESIEEYKKYPTNLSGVVTGEVLTCEKIENSDHLHITKVNIGQTTLDIVCGAQNVAVNQKVLVALPGATIYPIQKSPIKIEKTVIRGYESNGMICAEDELGISFNHDGIVVLDPDTPVGLPASALFENYEDVVFEISITPNRTDALSYVGIAKDIAAALRNRYQHRDVKVLLPSVEEFAIDGNELFIPVEIEATEACYRYSGLTMSSVKNERSPKWLENLLLASGLRPINAVVDVTQFVMYETGQPLHAFDADKIKGGKVIVRFLPEGTSFVTLDGKERKLLATDLMICDEEEGMCIAGVMGGEESGVTFQTTNIFLESAWFHPSYIRKTARYHNLHTDAAYRFERGTNIEGTIFALKRAANLIKELTGARIASEVVDVYPVKKEKAKVHFSLAHLQKFLGQSIEADVVFEILQDLDFEVQTDKTTNTFSVVVPPYRVDVTRKEDVYEEILRIYAYNRIEIPEHQTINYQPFRKTFYDFKNEIRSFFAGMGFQEVLNNSLSADKWFIANGLASKEDLIYIENPLSQELNVMRAHMLPSLLETAAYNLRHFHEDVRVFELGKTYRFKDKQKKEITEKIQEDDVLGVLMLGKKNKESWKYPKQKVDYYDLKKGIDAFFKKIALQKEIHFTEIEGHGFAFGITYWFEHSKIAQLGGVHPALLASWDIEEEVFYGEIYLNTLWSFLQNKKLKSQDVPKFPGIRRDLSLLLPYQLTFQEISNFIYSLDIPALKDINLFDVYIQPEWQNTKKSYALSFYFIDPDRTLQDEEVDRWMQEIMNALSEKWDVSIR